MTLIGKSTRNSNWLYLYALVNPASGANNVVISVSPSSVIYGASASYTGVAQTGMPDAFTTNNNGGTGTTSLTVSLTTIADNCWTILIGTKSTGGAISAGTGSTKRTTASDDASGFGLFDSNTPITPAASTSMSISWATSSEAAAVMASFAPLASTAHTSTLTETITLTGSIIRTATKVLTQTITNTDTLIKTATRTLSETITNTASFLSQIIHAATLSDVIANTDVLNKAPGKMLVEGAGPIDSYSESNQDAVSGIAAGNIAKGQTFTGIASVVASCKWYLSKEGAPTGNAVARIYAMSGTFGTNGNVTGSPLATSDSFDVSTLTGSLQLISFIFSGANQITLSAATHYVLTVEFTGGDAGNYVNVGSDGSSPTHAGNYSVNSGGTWFPGNTIDFCFYVYATLSGGITSTDTFTSSFLRASTLTETLANTATFLKTTTRTLLETITNSDTFIRSAVRTLSETLTNTDTFTAARVLPLTLSEVLSAADTFIRSATKVLSETITNTDTFIRSAARSLAETITNTDTYTSLSVFSVTFIETLSNIDTFIKATTRTLTETITNTDIITSTKVFLRTYTEAITLTDAFTKLRTAAAVLTETITSADTFARVVSFARTFTEAITLTDTIRKLRNGITVIWSAVAKAASLFTKTEKSVSTWDNQEKTAGTWDNVDKP